MNYQLFQVPSNGENLVDIVWVKGKIDKAFSHLAYTVETNHKKDNVLEKRVIDFNALMPSELLSRYPDLLERLKARKPYQVAESAIANSFSDCDAHIRTVLRLGALELLANIHSGRITASDKDPFPHQLALQQYIKNNESRIKRVLIADEVGLGKTIEVGLILRDRLIAQPNNFRCLYLAPGGLTEDVKEKLSSVIKSPEDKEIIRVVDSFKNYGGYIPSDGICVASLNAARRYLDKKDKKKLPSRVRPNIVIIDECHHCGSKIDLIGTDPKDISRQIATKSYKAVRQIINGEYWEDSEPPELVILMSATPFRSESQFTNLLRLLAHQVAIDNAFAGNIGKEELLEAIKKEDSPVSIFWRQQDEILSWSNKKLFPKLTILRPHLERPDLAHEIIVDNQLEEQGDNSDIYYVSEENSNNNDKYKNLPRLAKVDQNYLDDLNKIKKTLKEIYQTHDENFGGFSSAHLETCLTSSSLAGACWIFRWCVRHHSVWNNDEVYRSDISEDTEKLRELIKEISRQMASFDENRDHEFASEVRFPSDNNFVFQRSNLQGKVPQVRQFQIEMLNKDEEKPFVADSEEIVILADLALKLLRSNGIIENAKLDWLKQMLLAYPNSRFLVFTEVLQTTAIITATFKKESVSLTGNMSLDERREAIRKFYDKKKNYRILVATSAADEGLDFQVANKVVHWDLSPDPSVLMQRNGRVARLGQVSDVTAYYLILEGTLAYKRDCALLRRLSKAGITDPKMLEKIYGIAVTISNDEDFETGAIDQIIKKAREINDLMESQFRELSTHQLNIEFVIGRDELKKRLQNWLQLDYLKFDIYKHQMKFETRQWERPIFTNSGTTSEKEESKILSFTSTRGMKERVICEKPSSKNTKRIIFDQEFGLFGQEKEIDSLAGLYPWDVPGKNMEMRRYQSNRSKDYIGSLCETLARQKNSDFIAISKQAFVSQFPELENTKFLMFATHPLRELENVDPQKVAKYLTYYNFPSDFQYSTNVIGASASEIYRMISFLEEQALTGFIQPDTSLINEISHASTLISDWVNKAFKTPSSEWD
ncbi:DEAD/DEAH box helicase [Synechocystis sp. PCC 7339]|uniref:DEAD/DEAH box helicase n=1 Tax=Synechocystis sp. PCC 7339 TaxID=2782213 RepID=UPI001CBEE2F5|nr:DEAD/DEAH box helicase [Synechocystis sp. PCC 7339]UAJ71989.1 DEAD/DEAH box helicase [Synechocystis sp. PCC 7339]